MFLVAKEVAQMMIYVESTPSIFVEAFELVDNTLGFSDESAFKKT